LVILGYIYRFASNFAFLALVYLTLNFLSKYSERSIIAFLVLVYSSMRIVSTIRPVESRISLRSTRKVSPATDAGA